MRFTDVVATLESGEVVAYPTEGVWGLGCDPFDESAVKKVYELKRRPENKSVILLVKDWEQAEALIDPAVSIDREKIKATWPGPVTWVVPASNQVPDFLRAADGTIALRMPSYVFLQKLLEAYGKPLVSTSANLSSEPTARTEAELRQKFPAIAVCSGECEGRQSPSEIYHAISGERLR